MNFKLIIIAVAFALMSGTCTPEDQPQTQAAVTSCHCFKVNYERQQTGWSGASPVYTFVEVSRTVATAAECSTAVDAYTNDGTGHWYRIICN